MGTSKKFGFLEVFLRYMDIMEKSNGGIGDGTKDGWTGGNGIS